MSLGRQYSWDEHFKTGVYSNYYSLSSNKSRSCATLNEEIKVNNLETQGFTRFQRISQKVWHLNNKNMKMMKE